MRQLNKYIWEDESVQYFYRKRVESNVKTTCKRGE